MDRSHVCPVCGGTMVGDGHTQVLHCENVDDPELDYMEPDAPPVYCSDGDATICRRCGKPHQLTELDVGSDREVERLCISCYTRYVITSNPLGERKRNNE